MVNACKSLGIPVLLCRAHRINSAVMWMLGIAGSDAKCQNKEMKKLIQKAAALVGVFSHSAVNNDALREVQRKVKEEEIREELEAMAAEATVINLAQGEFLERAKEMAACSEEPINLESIKFDILNLVRRNDTRWVFPSEGDETFGVVL